MDIAITVTIISAAAMQCLNLDPNLWHAWKSIQGVLDSAFVSASLSALAGAALGVLGAQKLAERSSRRKELLDGLRQANALVVLATTMANQALGMKRQNVAPLSKRYFEDRKAIETLHEILQGGGIPKEVPRFRAEFVHITPLTVPVEALKSLTYSAQLMPGRALALVATVEQFLTELSHAIGLRSQEIEQFKSLNLQGEQLAQRYFGLRRSDGNIDSTYHDLMVAVTQYTDDVTFFSAELADELQAHAARIRKSLSSTKNVPKAFAVDFTSARESGLMPPREAYESWLSGFKSED